MIAQANITKESLRLLTELKNSNIRFAHWKGNNHLLEALVGKTDIELLIFPDDQHTFESAMAKLGFKKLKSQPWNVYPMVEDWIGFDYETGTLLHLHTHYALVVAIRYGLYLSLPWIKEFFTLLKTDELTGWPIPVPALEATILFIRIWTKVKNKPQAEADLLHEKHNEVVDLLNKAQPQDFEYVCEKLKLKLPDNLDDRLERIVRQGDLTEVKYLSRYFYQQIAATQERSQVYSSFRFLLYKYYLKSAKSYSKFSKPLKLKKTMHNGGKVIALIGSDGSGKSTLSNDITKWLTFKIDTHYFYMGKKPFIRSYDQLHFSKADVIASKNKLSRLLKKLAGDFYHVMMIKQKADMLHTARELSREGSIIICDRFPQKDILGINDGPRLQRKKLNWSSQVEMRLYNKVTEEGVDLVFRLLVAPEVAFKRKPEHNFAMIQQKCNNINKITFRNSKVIDLDASKPYDQVLLEVKRQIWKHL
ncbi:hypothetical protein POKO110462_06315 [Pontibacter korlensis]|uniref:Thymidylate kinase-like domain-containing protein n=1 Tax=Pontibacter korlensis TaxID=400092 RepID=A0A0E3ZI34_9BACT|nr:hypothetical protein [Pontibacter korlensis]AKD04405.1 hypothetical protein PKOR_16570 [Pontibacter korlensis]